ncbi:ArnT family glycosyltransferase [Lutibaculum baratangense]|uniref:Glycosyltransferase RgtA/B/C/D-like domain-containing protein n=1 Tax=Lutibaculum baratangense AMV1 TaxID=631454 RepID=V4RJH4_9HYPH|nr:glycosyltransferase family 39 protein [Lutibaculum baratangense]ESR23385.1 hypothetical protein N177_3453 [Lutibaculum baratangense AMV1]
MTPHTLGSPGDAGNPTRPLLPLWGWSAAIGAIMAVTLLRLVALPVSPSELGPDEAQYWTWSRELAFGYFTKPPLIAWLIRAETEICGSGAACVRIAAPFLHLATAVTLGALGNRIYGRSVGALAAVIYALMPGVAVSSFLMTTDVPLLFLWSVALYALVCHVERPGWASAIVFGVAAGLGLNAKYAMIYLPAMAVLAAVALPEVRAALVRRYSALAALIMLALIAPNLWWNAAHGFATFSHTGENIGWSISRLNPVGGFEFLAAQFGVAGPAVMVALLAALLAHRRSSRPRTDLLLLWLSCPVLAAITLQGFLSSANANWGAAAYPAGVVVASAIIVDRSWHALRVANVVLCGLLALAIAAGAAFVDPTSVSGPARQLRQLGGWSQTARALEEVAREEGARTLVINGRNYTAGFVYALREAPIEVLSYFPEGTAPSHHFHLDRPWRPGDGGAGTFLFGFDLPTAERLGAHPVADIQAPLYNNHSQSMTVYALP